MASFWPGAPVRGRYACQVRWSELARAIGGPVDPEPVPDPEITGIAYDSGQVEDGMVFVAVPGQHHDGHDFVETAFDRGAALAVVQRRVEAARPQVVVEDSRRALAQLAAVFFGRPSERLQVVGVTGTDGKTTTTTLLQAALSESLGLAGSLSTVDFRMGREIFPNLSRQTTLESLDLQRWLRRMADASCRAVALEATSHGLALGRLDSVRFAGAVFTNITHEHLDFHGTWEAYFEAKASLLARAGAAGGFAVLNRDDQRAFPELRRRAPERTLTYSAQGNRAADLVASGVAAHGSGLGFRARTPAGPAEVHLGMAGRWNVGNALAALGAGLLMEQPLEALVRGLERLPAISGRMESVELGQPFSVIVDYAHTPAALTQALAELRSATAGRLWVVFGSAGERDLAKRREMGRIAARLADQVVITSEDPRGEDPRAIVEEIAAGAVEAGRQQGVDLHLEPDREQAVRLALGQALRGDTVLLAGKGHERSIIGADGSQPWDEREMAVRALRQLRRA